VSCWFFFFIICMVEDVCVGADDCGLYGSEMERNEV
jgi:hypothetical protein